MAFTNQDFEKGLDFTGVSPVTGADFNVLVDNAEPIDTRSINLYSVDTALNTPDVPDPLTLGIAKFKRYIWIRVPYHTATDKTPKIYCWNDQTSSDPTMLKWLQVVADLDAVNTRIDAVEETANDAQTTADGLASAVNTANNTANTALTTAIDAETTANGLASAVQAATDAAQDAQEDADEAKNLANQALTAANAALTAANAPETSEVSRYCKITHTEDPGVHAGGSTAGANIRILNTVNTTASFASLDAVTGYVTLAVGAYRINAVSCAGLTASDAMQSFLMTTADALLLSGTPERTGTDTKANVWSKVRGIITLASETAVKLVDYHSSTIASSGRGVGVTLGPAGAKQEFAILEIEKL